jgi:2-polyprenyl-6-methoxyphenol hydroxylase-like FAD-dependent oxidoreductase
MSGQSTVLISGVGVAGPALAYWLLQAGMTPVLIDVAPRPRFGGYMIDFWGAGFEVAERMGVAESLRAIGYKIDALKLVDGRGRVQTKLGVGALTKALGDQYVSLQRGDLAATLFGRVMDRVETIFGDEVVSLAQAGHGVMASFRRRPARRFDLVIGADGLHSNIRRLAFPAGSNFETSLGYHFAAFTAEGYPHRDERAYVSRTTVGRQVARYGLRNGLTAFFMIFDSGLIMGRQLATPAQQRAFLASAFSDVGWESRDLIAALERCDELYFDSASQVRMRTWSAGRVALVGDAAYGPSLLAGEGAALAMLGAYTLAGELAEANGDHRRAYSAYELRLKSFMERKQRMALRMGSWFAPRSALGLFMRNQFTRLAGLPGLGGLMFGPMIADRISLPAYGWPQAQTAPRLSLAGS